MSESKKPVKLKPYAYDLVKKQAESSDRKRKLMVAKFVRIFNFSLGNVSFINKMFDEILEEIEVDRLALDGGPDSR